MDERTLARFMNKIEVQPNGCWMWKGKPNRQGYGRFWMDGKTRYAHVVAFKEFVGPIPDGFEVDHACHTRDEVCPGGVCDHRLCVNYADGHLEAVPQYENIMRSRGVAPKNAAKTHCDNGHAFDEANTHVLPNGERMCRTCQAQRLRDWAKANRIRGTRGWHQREKTHCPHGHEYTPENTYTRPGVTGRHCRECMRKRNREAQRERRKAAKAAKPAGQPDAA